MNAADRTLELSSQELRRLIEDATERILAYIESLPRQPSASPEGGADLARSLREPLPETGRPSAELLDLLFDKVIPKGFNTAGPGYLAYIPGGGVPHAAVADLIADATNRYVGVFAAAPGLAQIETNVVSWFCEIVGYPETARGILTTGGSLANFSAVVTARRERLPEDFLSGTIYASDQVHHSIQKAAMLAGFPEGNVREIASDERFRIRVDGARARGRRGSGRGEESFPRRRQRRQRQHGRRGRSRGARGPRRAGTPLVPRGRGVRRLLSPDRAGPRGMAGAERSDSIALDPHKSLFLPYGTGSLLVRDGDALKRAHALSAVYLPSMQEDPDLVDFNQISPELSRDWRGLRVWLPLKMHGIEPFRRNLDEKLDLAAWAGGGAAKDPGHRDPGRAAALDRRLPAPSGRAGSGGRELSLNRDLMDRINGKKRIYLTGTMLGSRFAIRICVLSFRTHSDRMEEGLEDIRRAVEETKSSGGDEARQKKVDHFFDTR